MTFEELEVSREIPENLRSLEALEKLGVVNDVVTVETESGREGVIAVCDYEIFGDEPDVEKIEEEWNESTTYGPWNRVQWAVVIEDNYKYSSQWEAFTVMTVPQNNELYYVEGGSDVVISEGWHPL